MKISRFFASLGLVASAFTGQLCADEETISWSVVKNSPLFATTAEFDFKSGDVVESKVIRDGLFWPRYYYDLYDKEGLQARGITRALSWGLLFPWGTVIDIYAHTDDEKPIGKIEGQFFTKGRAKFAFYNEKGEPQTVAYLNSEKAHFVFTSMNDVQVLGNFMGKAFGDLSVWDMENVEQIPVDPKILKIFAAFIADYHNSFLPPVRTKNYYYFHREVHRN